MSPAQSPPRFWQFSIKSILLLTLLVAAFLAGKVSSDKKLAMATKAEEEARKREAARAKATQAMAQAEAERATRAEMMARIQAMRAQEQAQAQLHNARTRLGAEQYLRQEAEAALRHASRERTVAEKKLKELNAAGNGLVQASQGKMAWLDVLKAIEDSVSAEETSSSGPAKKVLKINSISSKRHADLSLWFDKLPEVSRTKHMHKQDAARPPAGSGHVITLAMSCSAPKPNEPPVVPETLRRLLARLRRRPFTHVTVVPRAAQEKAARAYIVEFVWKG